MATVLQNYRICVLAFRPNARLKVVKDETGFHSYQVMDGDETIGRVELDKTIAWREAGRVLSDEHGLREVKRERVFRGVTG